MMKFVGEAKEFLIWKVDAMRKLTACPRKFNPKSTTQFSLELWSKMQVSTEELDKSISMI